MTAYEVIGFLLCYELYKTITYNIYNIIMKNSYKNGTILVVIIM